MHTVDDSPIRWKQDESDGLVTLVLDAPGAPVNTITVEYVEVLDVCVTRLEAIQDSIPGVVIRSGKKSFLAGGDLNRLMAVEPENTADFVADLDARKAITRRLELLRCPVVAIINGPVLGGGLELALCCHHSIAIADGRAVAGLPESMLGLIPGAGGIVRTVDRLGIDTALDEVILPGAKFGLERALELGLLDAVAGTVEEADAMAAAWIVEHRDHPQRTVNRPASSPRPLAAATAVPNAAAITAVANAVLVRDFDTALHIESVALGEIVTSRGTKNSIGINFFDSARLRKSARGLSVQPAAAVRLVPASAAAQALVDSLAGYRAVTAGVFDADLVHPAGPDAYIRLDAVPAEDWPRLWIVGDAVGDGQTVLEYDSNGSSEASAAISALAGAGLLPIPVTEGRSLKRAVEDALRDAIAAQQVEGVGDDRIAAALAWAGLRSAAAELSPDTTADPGEVDLACAILDVLAKSLVALLGSEADDLAAAIATRAGGFPSWTGGAHAWLDGGAELARELASADVASALSNAGRRPSPASAP